MLDELAKHPFLKQAGWDGSAETLVGEDWSQRRISRLEKNGKTAILMQSVPDDQPQVTMGHKSRDYVKIDAYLRELGLSAPEIYASDLPRGLLLVEDLGSSNFHEMLAQGQEDAAQLYLTATDVLVHLYRETADVRVDLPEYYKGYVHTGRRRVIDWYAPVVRGRSNEKNLAEEYLDVWTGIETGLPLVPLRFQHVDFHPFNLVWMPERDGVKRVGLVDFQDAMRGPAPYDLANLLLDARRIVPGDIQSACLSRFKASIPAQDWEVFSAWYTVLACQFHCRIIGQAYRLAVEDNKTRLLNYVPVLQQHMLKDLQSPLLAPLRDFFDRAGIRFDRPASLDTASIAPLIGADAF